MKTSHKLLVSLVCIVTLAGCARNKPILFPQTTIMSHNSLPSVKKAILEAGKKRKWIMTEVAPGVIDGLQKSRDHEARIRITYTNKNYVISYAGSHNLRERNGTIHRSYNRWVNNLDKDIQLNLALLANQ
ncbi:hypothetical protein FE392_06730 [Xenorhabdus sp. 12]|uniref:Lipoprotein n=1 Tax=Xenorhabdus santafensis TaxID=2582833 RepID=A0ABU4S8B3_9GAMM|nr:hypothetical protein [Xenorhabdus sp. 12]MDX7987027.1 hypothetical protein [Xenorhabdus sp. 12]